MNSMGTLLVSMNGTFIDHNIATPYPGAVSYDCAGLFGYTCNVGVNPRWRHVMRLTWDTPWHVLASAAWRFIGPTTYDNNSPNPSLAGLDSLTHAFDPTNARIAGYNYLDLTAAYTVIKGLEIRAGVSNVFDKDPPLLNSQITAESANNTFQAYDTLGRQLFVAFTAKF